MHTRPPLNMPCILQSADDDYACVEATENDEGLDLQRRMPEDPCVEESADSAYWGRLSLEGWHTLAEMYALRHPERFARIVARWRFLQEATTRTDP